jgi:hypothetical protein
VVADWIPYISFMRWAFQVSCLLKIVFRYDFILFTTYFCFYTKALCINEFKGKEYSCSGTTGDACLPDGEAVLKSLSFDEQNLRQAVLGLGVMLMFFLFSAILILELNRMRFMPMGHVGSKMKNLKDENDDEIKTGTVPMTAAVPVPSEAEKNVPADTAISMVEISLKNDKLSL